jgi:hypothetical protein
VTELTKYIFRQEKSDYGGIVDPAKIVFIGRGDGRAEQEWIGGNQKGSAVR